MRSSLPLQEPEQLASDDTRETAADLALALALGGASRHIPLGRLVVRSRSITMVCSAR
jgi:hypothetical protein